MTLISSSYNKVSRPTYLGVSDLFQAITLTKAMDYMGLSDEQVSNPIDIFVTDSEEALLQIEEALVQARGFHLLALEHFLFLR